MDYFLDIYDIKSWSDYSIKVNEVIYKNTVEIMILDAMIKKHYDDIVFTYQLLYKFKYLMIELGRCSMNDSLNDVKKVFEEYAKEILSKNIDNFI